VPPKGSDAGFVHQKVRVVPIWIVLEIWSRSFRRVRVAVLTNSLAATDVAAVSQALAEKGRAAFRAPTL